MEKDRIRIVALCGTSRPGNYTSRALALVVDELEQIPDVGVITWKPDGKALALPGLSGGEEDRKILKQLVTEATGIVWATPEYHGSLSACSKLMIENLGFPSAISGKPVVTLGVAAGQIGAIKALEQLRSILSHVGAIPLPGPVSVAGVQRVFDESGACLDPVVEKRIRGIATNLVDYIRQNICPRIALEALVRE